MLSLCDQVFQLVPIGETKKEDRLGLHAFPTRAHRLQRWFGVRHFLIISSVASGFFPGKDGHGKSTEHPWGSRKMGTYKHIYAYIYI